MTREADAAIKRMILDIFRKAGFADVGVPGPQHGFDMTKIPATSVYYYPCKRPDGFLVEYRDGRKPIDPVEWVKRCPHQIVDLVIDGSTGCDLTIVEELPSEGYRLAQQTGFDRAKDLWRSHGIGDGNSQFHKLGWRLFGLGMAMTDIEQMLRSEARYSRSPNDRLSQVPFIISDIRRKGGHSE